MNRLETEAVILTLIKALRDRGSWCGETHVQKTAFLAIQLEAATLPFEFILYKHGPFSFELRDELTAMRAKALLNLEAQPYPYGARFTVAPAGEALARCFSSVLEPRRRVIEFVAQKLAGFGVATLERLATALYFTSKEKDPAQRAARIHAAKPHISRALAESALNEIDALVGEWRECAST